MSTKMPKNPVSLAKSGIQHAVRMEAKDFRKNWGKFKMKTFKTKKHRKRNNESTLKYKPVYKT